MTSWATGRAGDVTRCEVTGRPAAAAACAMLLGSASPLLLDGPVPLVAGLAVVGTLTLLAGLVARRDADRTWVALAAVGWVAAGVTTGSGPVVPVVLLSGLALRVWAGLSELLQLRQHALTDLVPELIGGGAAAALVLYASGTAQRLPSAALLLAVVGGLLLCATAAGRLRR